MATITIKNPHQKIMFYTPNILKEQSLSENESRHAIKVLRLTEGDEITLLDGCGGIYKANITLAHPKHCEFEITAQQQKEPNPYPLHIAIAPTKNIDRMEWFVEKCTEIGIDEITPIFCQFSERKQLKSERLEKIIIAASKQAQRSYFPILHPSTSFQNFIDTHIHHNKYIAHCYNTPKEKLFDIVLTHQPTLTLIGPEGDFSTAEVEKAIQMGYKPITLGENRLRTETAGIIACHTIALKNQINRIDHTNFE